MTSSDFPQVLVVIPLRLASQRVPRKILADIGGKSLSVRSVGQVRAAFQGDAFVRVIAAVDDAQTEKHLRAKFPDLEIILTSPEIPSGTDRVFAATTEWLRTNPQGRKCLKGVINVQGDMPFAGLEGLRQAAGYYKSATEADLARFAMITLAQSWPREQKLDTIGAVKVISDREGGAIYFSRHPIPYSMKKPPRGRDETPIVSDLHLGLYGYTLECLARFASHAPIELERAESLEQLRALWLGIRILVLKTEPGEGESYRGIDTPADLSWAKRFAAPKKSKAKPKKKKATKKK